MRPVNQELLRIDAELRKARLSALSRAYPLLKQAAEILELEEIEPQARATKRVRQEIGALLALEDPNGTTEFGA